MSLRLTLADALTWSRIGAVPVLGACVMASRPTAFAVVLLLALATDALDGPVARARGTVSVYGGQFDSAADALVYLTAPTLALMVYPDLRHGLGATMLVIACCFAIPPAAGWLRFRRLPSYHTRLARLAAVALAVAFAAYVAASLQWPMRVAAVLLVLSTIEEVAITWLLPQWTHPVSGVRQAWQLARVARIAFARGPAAFSHPDVPRPLP